MKNIGREQIENHYKEYRALSSALLELKVPNLSGTTFITEVFSKYLIISCASYFEYHIINLIRLYLTKMTHEDEFILSFINQSHDMISKKYFQLFEFGTEEVDKTHAKSFYKLFGSYGNSIAKEISENADLKVAENCFLEIGRARNILVHNNFICNTATLAPDEIIEKFHIAEKYYNHLIALFEIGFAK